MTKYDKNADHGPNTSGAATIKPTGFGGSKSGNEIRQRENSTASAPSVGVVRPKGLKSDPWHEMERKRLTGEVEQP